MSLPPFWVERERLSDSVMEQAMARGYCPTKCDDECEFTCHETHYMRWQRAHDPSDCPANLVGSARKEAHG